MEKIAIVTDSNSGITQEEGKKLGVYVIPMPFTIDGEEYLEDISISQAKFFELLEKGADVKTSQPSEYSQEKLFDELLKTFDKVLFIPMSSGLSGACENAKNVALKYGGRVLVVDNQRISVTQKMSVLQAIELKKENKTAKEIKEYLEETKDKSSIYITLTTLKYLCKGGRITPAVAVLGNLLNLKPILYTRGQSFDKCAITMSLGQAKKKMIEKIKHDIEGEFKDDYEEGKMAIVMAYSKDNTEALKFKEEAEKVFGENAIIMVETLSLSVSCHTGAGALGIGVCNCEYLKK